MLSTTLYSSHNNQQQVKFWKKYNSDLLTLHNNHNDSNKKEHFALLHAETNIMSTTGQSNLTKGQIAAHMNCATANVYNEKTLI